MTRTADQCLKTLDAVCVDYGVAKLEIPMPCVGSEPGRLKLLVTFGEIEPLGQGGLRRYFGLQEELTAIFQVPVELASEDNDYFREPVDRRTLYPAQAKQFPPSAS